MLFKTEVHVTLKPGHSDPEGETTMRSLRELGFPVSKVEVSKVYTVFLSASSEKMAKEKTGEMCVKLLANPTKDNYVFRVEKAQ